MGDLYDRDFLLWTKDQAAALRRAKGANLPLDWENLAEEIESLGISQRTALRSQLRRILRHLFKLEASPRAEPRRGWKESVRGARAEIEDILGLAHRVLVMRRGRIVAGYDAGEATMERVMSAAFAAEREDEAGEAVTGAEREAG